MVLLVLEFYTDSYSLSKFWRCLLFPPILVSVVAFENCTVSLSFLYSNLPWFSEWHQDLLLPLVSTASLRCTWVSSNSLNSILTVSHSFWKILTILLDSARSLILLLTVLYLWEALVLHSSLLSSLLYYTLLSIFMLISYLSFAS